MIKLTQSKNNATFTKALKSAGECSFSFTPHSEQESVIEKALNTRRLEIDVDGETTKWEVTQLPVLHEAPNEPLSIKYHLRRAGKVIK